MLGTARPDNAADDAEGRLMGRAGSGPLYERDSGSESRCAAPESENAGVDLVQAALVDSVPVRLHHLRDRPLRPARLGGDGSVRQPPHNLQVPDAVVLAGEVEVVLDPRPGAHLLQ